MTDESATRRRRAAERIVSSTRIVASVSTGSTS
jgi:hypothetical protein